MLDVSEALEGLIEVGACDVIVDAGPVELESEPKEAPNPSFALASPGRAH